MNQIKYLGLLICIVFGTTTVCSGQKTYSLFPNDTIQLTGGLEDLQTLTINQVNISSDTIKLKWKRLSDIVPSNWDVSDCDNRFCNTVLSDSGIMNPVKPGDSAYLLMHITAHVNYGTSIVRYLVWDIKKPSFTDTLTYIFTATNSTGIRSGDPGSIITILSNPANSFIQINVPSDIKRYTVYLTDYTGKVVYKNNCDSPVFFLPTETQTDGVYFLSIYEKEKLLRTKRIIIQH